MRGAGDMADGGVAMANGHLASLDVAASNAASAASNAASATVAAVTRVGEEGPLLHGPGVITGNRIGFPRRRGFQRVNTYEDSDSDSDEDDDEAQTSNRPSICKGGWKERVKDELHCPDGKGGWTVYSSAEKWRASMGHRGGKLSPEQIKKIRETQKKITQAQEKVKELSDAMQKLKSAKTKIQAVQAFKLRKKV